MKITLLHRSIAIIVTCLVCGLYAEEVYPQTITAKPVLKTLTDSAGRKIEYPAPGVPEVSGLIVTIPKGTETGWHIHTVPCFAYMLEGELSVEWADGSKHIVKAGDAFVEVVNLKHNGSNKGTVDAKLVMFVAGIQGMPYTVKQK